MSSYCKFPFRKKGKSCWIFEVISLPFTNKLMCESDWQIQSLLCPQIRPLESDSENKTMEIVRRCKNSGRTKQHKITKYWSEEKFGTSIEMSATRGLPVLMGNEWGNTEGYRNDVANEFVRNSAQKQRKKSHETSSYSTVFGWIDKTVVVRASLFALVWDWSSPKLKQRNI